MEVWRLHDENNIDINKLNAKCELISASENKNRKEDKTEDYGDKLGKRPSTRSKEK